MDSDTSSVVNPLKESIDCTLTTIEHRSRYYRNTIIVVVIVVAGGIITPLVMRSWKPLCILLFLPAVVNVFILSDCRVIGSWRKKALDLWNSGKLDLNTYTQTISMMKTLPTLTTGGMIKLLPLQSGIGKNDNGLREVTSATLGIIDASHILHSATVLSISIIISLSVTIAVVSPALWPLAGIGAGIVLPAAEVFLERNLWWQWRRNISRLISGKSLDKEMLKKALASLSWDSINFKRKRSVFQFLENNPISGGRST